MLDLTRSSTAVEVHSSLPVYFLGHGRDFNRSGREFHIGVDIVWMLKIKEFNWKFLEYSFGSFDVLVIGDKCLGFDGSQETVVSRDTVTGGQQNYLGRTRSVEDTNSSSQGENN